MTDWFKLCQQLAPSDPRLGAFCTQAEWRKLALELALKDNTIHERELRAIRTAVLTDKVVSPDELDFILEIRRNAESACISFNDFIVATLNKIKNKIIADGVISKDEVAWLRRWVLFDNKVSTEEVAFLNELRAAIPNPGEEFLALYEEFREYGAKGVYNHKQKESRKAKQNTNASISSRMTVADCVTKSTPVSNGSHTKQISKWLQESMFFDGLALIAWMLAISSWMALFFFPYNSLRTEEARERAFLASQPKCRICENLATTKVKYNRGLVDFCDKCARNAPQTLPSRFRLWTCLIVVLAINTLGCALLFPMAVCVWNVYEHQLDWLVGWILVWLISALSLWLYILYYNEYLLLAAGFPGIYGPVHAHSRKL